MYRHMGFASIMGVDMSMRRIGFFDESFRPDSS